MEIIVPATTANLGSGYDCLGLALNLYNRVRVESAPRLRIRVRGQGKGMLPLNEQNLVWRAACALFARLGVRPEPVALTMENAIPLSRGLGSSSAAIVAGLLLADHLTGARLDDTELLAMATELEGHPDNVAPALLGGLVVSVVEDGRVVSVPSPFPDELGLCFCIPEIRLATSRARQALPESVPHGDAVFNLSRVALLLVALQQQRYDLLPLAMADRLHQPYRLGLIPGAAEVFARAAEAGAAATVISGAGPAICALVPPQVAAEQVGEAMVAGFSTAGISARYRLFQVENKGAHIVDA
ncbi:MAG: homoserine kinase [Bacillota bacterium]